MRWTSSLGAEFVGTFVLVFGGTGSAVLAASFLTPAGADSGLGIGFAGVSLAFGLTVLTMAYAVGHISGGHFNPAITIGLAAAKRFAWKDAVPYIVTQVIAAIAASATLWVIAINHEGTTKDSLAAGGFAANGYGDHSPGQYNLFAGLVIEIVLTAVFLIVIMGTTDKRASKGFAALAIGLALTLIHFVSIPVTNTSVNPARSTGPAVMLAFGGESWGLAQFWLFWLAPIVGGVIGALVYQLIAQRDTISDAAVMGVDDTGPTRVLANSDPAHPSTRSQRPGSWRSVTAFDLARSTAGSATSAAHRPRRDAGVLASADFVSLSPRFSVSSRPDSPSSRSGLISPPRGGGHSCCA